MITPPPSKKRNTRQGLVFFFVILILMGVSALTVKLSHLNPPCQEAMIHNKKNRCLDFKKLPFLSSASQDQPPVRTPHTFFPLLSLLFHGYEPMNINTWSEFYESMEISFKKKNMKSFDFLDVNEICRINEQKNPPQQALSIYAFDAYQVDNMPALEFILLKGCWLGIPVIENDIPVWSRLECAEESKNPHFVALMLLYEPLPIKYKIEYLVKKVKSKQWRQLVQILGNMRNVVLHRISQGLCPLPDYIPEHLHGLYYEWDIIF